MNWSSNPIMYHSFTQQRMKKKRFMLLGKLGSDKCFTCGPNHLHFLLMLKKKMQRNSREHLLMCLSRKGPASVSEFTQHQVTTAQQTGMDGILILNLLRARNELLRKNILRGVCRFLDEGFTVLSIFKAWEVPPSASHWTIILSNLFLLCACFITFAWCCCWFAGCSIVTLCFQTVQATFGGEWPQWLTWTAWNHTSSRSDSTLWTAAPQTLWVLGTVATSCWIRDRRRCAGRGSWIGGGRWIGGRLCDSESHN